MATKSGVVILVATENGYRKGHCNIPAGWDPQDCDVRQHIILQQQDEDLWLWAQNPQEPYGWSQQLPTLDFNREMFAPGQNEKFPLGIVGIRTDDDFWSVAALPWRFHTLSVEVIVSTLWPSAASDKQYNIGYDRGPAADLSIQHRLQRLEESAKTALRAVEILKEEIEELRAAAKAGAEPFYQINFPRPLEPEPTDCWSS